MEREFWNTKKRLFFSESKEHIADRQKNQSKTKDISKAQFIDEEVGIGGIKKQITKQAAANSKIG